MHPTHFPMTSLRLGSLYKVRPSKYCSVVVPHRIYFLNTSGPGISVHSPFLHCFVFFVVFAYFLLAGVHFSFISHSLRPPSLSNPRFVCGDWLLSSKYKDAFSPELVYAYRQHSVCRYCLESLFKGQVTDVGFLYHVCVLLGVRYVFVMNTFLYVCDIIIDVMSFACLHCPIV